MERTSAYSVSRANEAPPRNSVNSFSQWFIYTQSQLYHTRIVYIRYRMFRFNPLCVENSAFSLVSFMARAHCVSLDLSAFRSLLEPERLEISLV